MLTPVMEVGIMQMGKCQPRVLVAMRMRSARSIRPEHARADDAPRGSEGVRVPAAYRHGGVRTAQTPACSQLLSPSGALC
jgi:hypothetical protein